MKNTVGTLVFVLLLLSSNITFGAELDGNQLLSDCNALIILDSIKDSTKDKERCYGIVKLMEANRCLFRLKGMNDLNIMKYI